MTSEGSVEDRRLTEAQDLLIGYNDGTHEYRTISNLLAYAEERLRINVGLISENSALKKRLAELENGS